VGLTTEVESVQVVLVLMGPTAEADEVFLEWLVLVLMGPTAEAEEVEVRVCLVWETEPLWVID
jgi:hypothetical protein